MKILIAHCCYDLVVPKDKNKPVYCRCGTSCVWWEDPSIGDIAVYSSELDNVSLLGLTNSFIFTKPQPYITKKEMEDIIKDIPENYLFKQMNSVAVKFQPGYTGDSRFISDKSLIPNQ